MSHFYLQVWDRPYLTPSIARILHERTPLHAKLECPYYVREREPETTKMTEGAVVDALVFGTQPDVVVLDFDSFRTKEAKEARDALLEARQPYLLREAYERCAEAADRLTRGAVEADPMIEVALRNGVIRQRRFWEELVPSAANADTFFRLPLSCEPDIDLPQYDAVLDLKRTAAIPTEGGWRRQVSRMNYHLQVAATLEATGRSHFAWLVVEANEPHCAVVHWASDEFIEVAKRDWRAAKETWARCVETGNFPGYEGGTIDPMPWQLEPEDQLVFDEDESEEEAA